MAEATNLRRDNDGSMFILLFQCWSDKHGSEDETDAGQNQQRIDDELELSIREPLEDTQSEPRAEQGSRNESERGPVMQPVTLVVIYLMRPSSSTAPPLEQARTIVRLLSALSVPEQPSAGVVADGG